MARTTHTMKRASEREARESQEDREKKNAPTTQPQSSKRPKRKANKSQTDGKKNVQGNKETVLQLILKAPSTGTPPAVTNQEEKHGKTRIFNHGQ